MGDLTQKSRSYFRKRLTIYVPIVVKNRNPITNNFENVKNLWESKHDYIYTKKGKPSYGN